jgi:large subunit ribosomal protein L21
VVIFIVLVFVFLSSYFSSTGIQEAKPEVAAEAHDDHGHDQPHAEAPTVVQTETAPTALAAAPEKAVAVAEKKETAVVSPPAPPPAPVAVEPDDLKKIEGIGPKIEGILHEAGILTYAQLAAADVSYLEKVVREDAGIRVAFPTTWPEQAKLAADGLWDTLEKLQEDLKGGRRE